MAKLTKKMKDILLEYLSTNEYSKMIKKNYSLGLIPHIYAVMDIIRDATFTDFININTHPYNSIKMSKLCLVVEDFLENSEPKGK